MPTFIRRGFACADGQHGVLSLQRFLLQDVAFFRGTPDGLRVGGHYRCMSTSQVIYEGAAGDALDTVFANFSGHDLTVTISITGKGVFWLDTDLSGDSSMSHMSDPKTATVVRTTYGNGLIQARVRSGHGIKMRNTEAGKNVNWKIFGIDHR